MIRMEVTQFGTLLTLVNYEDFQDHRDTEGTRKGHAKDAKGTRKGRNKEELKNDKRMNKEKTPSEAEENDGWFDEMEDDNASDEH